MRIALSLVCAIPVAAAGAVALLALPTGSPASDVFDLGPQISEATGVDPSRSQPRTFAPQHALTTASPPASQPPLAVPSPVAAIKPAATPRIVVAQVNSAPAAKANAATDVKSGTISGNSPAAATPTRQTSRHELATALQKELKRVGCYTGETNGEWTGATRQAMGAFLQRLNASLPTAEPDFILLTLVQGQTVAACTAGCPSGQAMLDNGRCVPAPSLVQRNTKSADQFVAAEPAAPVSTGKSPGIAAPWRTAVNPAKPAARPADPRVDTRAAAVAAAPAPVVVQAPAPQNTLSQNTPLQAAASPAQSISGRMAIGGPAAPAEVTTGATQSLSVAPIVNGEDHAKGKSAAPRKPDQQRSAEVARPRRDTSWTKGFFER